MAGGLTIGQAARFVGVTTKTVRHYHRVGLLDEPRRDRSGYRRYTSPDLLRLVQIRAFADAGVALSAIGVLLDGDPPEFTAALADAERRLDDRIAELDARRETLHRLADGPRALLPDRACAVLDRYGDLGFTDEFVALQREGLVLARAIAPDFLDLLLPQLERRLDDPGYVTLQKRAWEARHWDACDPRLDELAAAMAGNLLADRPLLEAQIRFFSTDSDSRYQVINRFGADELPAMARLNALVENRLRTALGAPVRPSRDGLPGS